MKRTDRETKQINSMKKTSGSALAIVQFLLPGYLIVSAIKNWNTIGSGQAIAIIVVSLVIAVLFFGYWNDVRKLLSIIDRHNQ